MATSKANAITDLVNIELYQEQEEAMRHRQVLRRQPSVLDVTADNSGEEFDWRSVDNVTETDEMDVDSDCSDSTLSGNEPATTVKQTKAQKPKRELLTQVAQQKNVVVIGGLTDGHASSVRPKFGKQKLVRTVTKIVGVVSDDSETDTQAIKMKPG
ncbi:hypothetical protein BYT27DRAFT_7213195 [Phlegmacium glaucopus]|nr:hypothetical protein BYT27DRAFT_7213195 [Phlegmacium glaucopus]